MLYCSYIVSVELSLERFYYSDSDESYGIKLSIPSIQPHLCCEQIFDFVAKSPNTVNFTNMTHSRYRCKFHRLIFFTGYLLLEISLFKMWIFIFSMPV